ncbi:metallophosphoesterase [Pseudoroseomonas cervicalis]|uniref:metallophosphoesterase family protein n=1 Tax=Teichococcus cervicalis TaxID=204525 RepID=UPI0027822312|nr:metallophosphoesterase family protein [Pseudoroseomonas cervicalis]MDQ1077635.1 diadenosine tetraphosphatase ApaH/serine/threonine PP2A family protein phosphatase [Pseudoroseomonas cervicalis]
MRYAVLADIHANREACEACLAHAAGHGHDRLVLLGDMVGYGGDPLWAAEFAQAAVAAGAIAVLGNHDEAVATGRTGGMSGDAATAAAWHRSVLPPASLAFLGALPREAEAEGIRLLHADPAAPESWNYVTDPEAARAGLDASPFWLTLCGHVHAPRLYGLTATDKLAALRPVPGQAVPLLRARRWLAVMGSVGQPRDGDPSACYAILDSERGECVWHRVPYDIEAAAARIRAAGLPERLAARLSEGR